ncbi:MAG: HD family phosphohydrolase [Oscillospiraceae bacterium]
MRLTSYVQYRHCIHGIIDSPVVQKMSQYIQHSDVSTLEHCILVSYLSFVVCRALGLNYYAAARGGLLHDLFLYDWHDIPVKVRSPKDLFRMHGFVHSKKALDNAYENFDLSLMEMDIIEKHMWPLTVVPPRYYESFVVSCMDKVAAILECMKLSRISMLGRVTAFSAVREQVISEILAVSEI